jgi:hypothetical protein
MSEREVERRKHVHLLMARCEADEERANAAEASLLQRDSAEASLAAHTLAAEAKVEELTKENETAAAIISELSLRYSGALAFAAKERCEWAEAHRQELATADELFKLERARNVLAVIAAQRDHESKYRWLERNAVEHAARANAAEAASACAALAVVDADHPGRQGNSGGGRRPAEAGFGGALLVEVDGDESEEGNMPSFEHEYDSSEDYEEVPVLQPAPAAASAAATAAVRPAAAPAAVAEAEQDAAALEAKRAAAEQADAEAYGVGWGGVGWGVCPSTPSRSSRLAPTQAQMFGPLCTKRRGSNEQQSGFSGSESTFQLHPPVTDRL